MSGTELRSTKRIAVFLSCFVCLLSSHIPCTYWHRYISNMLHLVLNLHCETYVDVEYPMMKLTCNHITLTRNGIMVHMYHPCCS